MWRSTLLVGLLLLTPAQAAEYGGDDPEGDVVYRDRDLGTVQAPRDHPRIDITSVRLHDETVGSFQVTLTVVGEDELAIAPSVRMMFRFDELVYTVLPGDCQDGSGSPALYVSAGLGGWEQTGCLDGGWIDSQTFQATVPKELVQDRLGLAIAPGQSITDLAAMASEVVASRPAADGSNVYLQTMGAWDFAPDEGEFPGALTMQLGATTGDLILRTPSPLRASNGGPDTVVYPVVAGNQGDTDQAMLLETSDLPPGWDVRAPGRLAVPAGQQVTFPVVVTTASAHSHGSTESFLLRASSQAGATTQLRLGIHYLDIPQLAGHHSTVFFHSIQAEDTSGLPFPIPEPIGRVDHIPWFNTLQVQPGADEGLVSPNDINVDENPQDLEFDSRWFIPLDPALLIGMDFQPDAPGSLAVGFVGDDRTLGDLDVAARLMHCHPGRADGEESGRYGCVTGSWFGLADAGTATFAVTPNAQWTWEPSLKVTEYADLVPYVDESNIALWIDGHTTASGFPRIDPTLSMMRLPLLEYKDPIDAAFEDLTSIRLAPLDPFEKKANAGQTVWFAFDVRNDGGDRDVRLRTFGHNAEWAVAAPEGRIPLDREESRSVLVRVDVLDEAAAGEFAEVLLLAEDADDPAVTAVSKVRVAVVDEPIPDEVARDVAGVERESPLPVLPMLLALALAVGRKRA